jgi:very-short-patch-repair endonuclease
MLQEFARRQYSIFTLAQALESGFTRPVIRRKLERGEWQEVEHRVYRVGTAGALDWRGRLMALTLSSGGVASHMSAAALFGLLEPPKQHEITVARAARSASTAWAHSSTSLARADITKVGRIPATAPARTLIDAAGSMRLEAFEDLLDLAIVTRVITPARLHARAMALRAPRRRGCSVVLELLDQRDPELLNTRSIWEARVLRMVRAAGLPRPRSNYRVHVGGRNRSIDFAWPAERVAAEFDGFVPHSTRRVFDDDRVRQNDLVDDDWLLFRLTKTALEADASRAFAPIARAIAKRLRNGTLAL